MHVAVVTRPYFQAKLKFDDNGRVLKAAPDTVSCFVDMLLHFFENANYGTFFQFHCRAKHSVSFRKLITKMKTGIIIRKLVPSKYVLKNVNTMQ